MHSRSLLFLQFCLFSCAQDIEIIRDYFLYKNVNSVAGFSCGIIEKDNEIIRMLNSVRISVSVKSIKSNVDVIQFLYTKYWKLGIFLDLRCSDKNARNIFDQASASRMYDQLYHWLVLTNNMSHAVNMLNDSTFSIVTDLTISFSHDDTYDLYEVYNRAKSHGEALNITKLGTWRKNEGMKITLEGSKISRRSNFHGMKVKVAGLVLNKPEEMNIVDYLVEADTDTYDNPNRFGYSMLVNIAEMFNFTLNVTGLSRWDKNDTNGPLMRGLQSGEYDLIFLPSRLTVERLDYGRVVMQVWPTRTCFMFRTIPAARVDMNMILGAFTTDSWYMIMIMLLIIIIVLSIILKLEKVDANPDYGSSVLIAIGALCQQGLPFSQPAFQLASRIVSLHVLLFGLLVYNYYSASIVSTRLNAPVERMNDSLHSLVQSGMEIAAEDSVYFTYLLRTPTEDVQFFTRYWESIQDENKYLPLKEGVERVYKGGFAYHTNPIEAYPLIDRMINRQAICELTEIHLLPPSDLALWSSHSGELNEIAKIGLIKLRTAGIREREIQHWSFKKPYCDKNKNFLPGVTLLEALPIIIILIGGILLSVIICFVENIIFRISHTGYKSNVVKEHYYNERICRKKLPI